MTKITVDKVEAATRQLDEAIELLFSDHDPLAIRTLAAAAHGLFADLVGLAAPESHGVRGLLRNLVFPKRTRWQV
ncbi:hypothetical protein FSO04_36875 [Paraburkholderia madseniana]|uniref:Uncharacterized protein n=1 Tax=Paraburkholderia madseniana TaxID=2599607 RepID=A0A6N6W2X2_9BURK|nr:hypothetical protein [Paraburkholderia madseniana]KAE8754962.1 hypothetical protein FSO04_36875 [Paraburkholderia madseniana]